MKITTRTPRSALLQITEAASAALADAPATSYADLTAALVRIERLANEALYPVAPMRTTGYWGEEADPCRPDGPAAARADACLIAAAPEMYEMLCQMIAEAVSGDVLDVTVRKATAILAKAEAP